jgi:uncharacterized membrane protein YhhN
MNTLFFVLYISAALANIVSIRYEKFVIRLVSKICLVPILMVFYIFKSGNISFAITSAMIFSWCGDILLVNPRKFGLYAGISSFLAAYILYAIAFIDLAPEVNGMAFIFTFLLVLSIERLLAMKLYVPNKYKFFTIIYGIATGFLVVSSLQVFIRHKSMASFLPVIGSLLFFVSDAVLAYFNTIKTMTKNSLAVVMASYSIAQACVVIGYMGIN